ncbi:DUF3549 family protein [Flocculibacter collagenilyticus]|uniref:DUF3549 family protein n=1 Tax=Flocculibacter collagenilyticus TaxID=2744479 RepID=UPI0018F75BCD|nr:DUF3549 family protein [Flocculibacter collagenilyticus]
MTDSISTISELLNAAGANWRIFDMGRKVQKITSKDFLAIEDTSIPYPYPIQQHAFFAVLFWQKEQIKAPFIWFLKMPLDEQSKLNQAARNHFATMVLESLGKNFINEAQTGEELNNNPYVFTPNQNKLALFNAIVKVELKQPASQYYEHTRDYLSGVLGWENWQGVGLQGLADISQRLSFENNEAIIRDAIDEIPYDVKAPLAAMLESANISTEFAELLLEKINTAIINNESQDLITYLRMLSNSSASGIKSQAVSAILNSQLANQIDVLSVIAGRMWSVLVDEELTLTYLEQLATNEQGFVIFQGLVADLVAIPTVRPWLLRALRVEHKSPKLTEMVGQLFR